MSRVVMVFGRREVMVFDRTKVSIGVDLVQAT
jgi:hypothetical protein